MIAPVLLAVLLVVTTAAISSCLWCRRPAGPGRRSLGSGSAWLQPIGDHAVLVVTGFPAGIVVTLDRARTPGDEPSPEQVEIAELERIWNLPYPGTDHGGGSGGLAEQSRAATIPEP
jgi:hypothetical protein